MMKLIEIFENDNYVDTGIITTSDIIHTVPVYNGGDEFKVYVVDNHAPTLHNTGNLIAGIFVLTTGQYVVLTDSVFKELSDITQKFVVLHEIGHVINKDEQIDLKDRVKIISDILKRKRLDVETLNREYNADAYAASRLGIDNSISALNEILELIHFSKKSSKEVMMRIDNLVRINQFICNG